MRQIIRVGWNPVIFLEFFVSFCHTKRLTFAEGTPAYANINRKLKESIQFKAMIADSDGSGYTRTRKYPPKPDLIQYQSYPTQTLQNSGIPVPARTRHFQ